MDYYKDLQEENLTTVYEGVEYTEEWKQMKEHHHYFVSSFGRIKTSDREYFEKGRKKPKIVKGRIRKLNLTMRGYPKLVINYHDFKKTYLTHRLVGEYFIDNPNNLPEINHKDGVKTNSFYKNLEYCTRLQNIRHAIETGLTKTKPKGYRTPWAWIPVKQMDMNFNEIKIWESATHAGEFFNTPSANITASCRGDQKTCCGFTWEYAKVSEIDSNLFNARRFLQNEIGRTGELTNYDIQNVMVEFARLHVETYRKVKEEGGNYDYTFIK